VQHKHDLVELVAMSRDGGLSAVLEPEQQQDRLQTGGQNSCPVWRVAKGQEQDRGSKRGTLPRKRRQRPRRVRNGPGDVQEAVCRRTRKGENRCSSDSMTRPCVLMELKSLRRGFENGEIYWKSWISLILARSSGLIVTIQA